MRNWRSTFGKTGIRAVQHLLTTNDELSTIEARADWVRDRLLDSAFVYENEQDDVHASLLFCTILTQLTQTGAYRSELILRVFAAHLQTVLKTDVSYGHPVGAMALSCAAVSFCFKCALNFDSFSPGRACAPYAQDWHLLY